MNILTFSTSLRKDSLNRKLVRLAADIAREKGVTVNTIDLNGFPLPPYDGDLEASGQMPRDLEQLRIQIAEHEALIVASPEYNFSMPGHFKNTFDWLTRTKPQPFLGKVVLLMSASPSLVGGNRGLWALRVPLEAVGSIVHPDMFSLASAHEAFDEKGHLKDPKAHERLRKTVETFVSFARALSR
jgi:chromate reductase, NAD(P)H dehydrogenase (quinone)